MVSRDSLGQALRIQITIILSILLVSGILAGVTLLGPGSVVGTVAAYHDHPEDASATFLPDSAEDRQPGATETTFNIWVGQGLDYKADWVVVESPGLDWSDCSTGDLTAEGIKWRGVEEFNRPPSGDDTQTRTDESIVQYSKAPDYRSEGLAVNWYADEDLGGDAPRFNSTDEIVAQYQDCFNNPEERGWYQMNIKLNGTDLDTGDRVSIEFETHYYGICECEDRAEAEEVLGPPPSRQSDDATATVTATAADDDGGDDPTATAADDDGGDDPTATAADDDGGDGGSGGDQADTDDSTPGSGAGFGIVVAVLAVLGAALLAGRPDR